MVAAQPADEPLNDAPFRHRDVSSSFGDDAEAYDRARPRYPRALVRDIVDGLPGREVLDVGIGTGISALPFRDAGCVVLGVDVDERMAVVARKRGFDVEVARFEEWDVAGRRFDAVIAGQTWHWIDPEAGAVTAGTVLRPGGCLAVFWNVGHPDADIAAAFADVYHRVDTGLPFTPWATPAAGGYSPILERTLEGIRASGAFADPQQRQYPWETSITTAEWVAQVPTAGGHSRLPADTLQRLCDGMAEVIDANGGAFTMHYTSLVVTATAK